MKRHVTVLAVVAVLALAVLLSVSWFYLHYDGVLSSPANSGATGGSPEKKSHEVDRSDQSRSIAVENDLGIPITDYSAHFQSESGEWQLLDSRFLPPQAQLLFVGAVGCAPRQVSLATFAGEVRIVLPRLATLQIQVKDGAYRQFAGLPIIIERRERVSGHSDVALAAPESLLEFYRLDAARRTATTQGQDAVADAGHILPGFEYYIQAELPAGLKATSKTIVAAPGASIKVNLGLGDSDFVSGRVVDMFHRPLQDVSVEASLIVPADAVTITAQNGATKTDADGGFVIALERSTPAGNADGYPYSVLLRVSRLVPDSGVARQEYASARVNVTSNSNDAGDIVLGDGHTIRGTVFADGKPAASQEVVFHCDRAFFYASTDAGGGFLAIVPTAEYMALIVRRNGYETYKQEFTAAETTDFFEIHLNRVGMGTLIVDLGQHDPSTVTMRVWTDDRVEPQIHSFQKASQKVKLRSGEVAVQFVNDAVEVSGLVRIVIPDDGTVEVTPEFLAACTLVVSLYLPDDQAYRGDVWIYTDDRKRRLGEGSLRASDEPMRLTVPAGIPLKVTTRWSRLSDGKRNGSRDNQLVIPPLSPGEEYEIVIQ